MNVASMVIGMMVSAAVGLTTLSELDSVVDKAGKLSTEVASLNYEQTVKGAIVMSNEMDGTEYKISDYTKEQVLKELVAKEYISEEVYKHVTVSAAGTVVVNNLEIGEHVASDLGNKLNKGE